MANRFVDATLRLVDKFSAPLGKATAEMQAKSRQIQKTANSIKRTGKSISSVGQSLVKNVTLPIVGVMTASGKMADTFQKDMGQVNTLLDDHGHLKSYKNMAIKTSNETGISLHTISQGVYQMISSIGDSGKKTQDIFNIAAKAAKGGGSSVQESVALISSAMKGYDSVNTKTAQSISDMAFQTQKLGVTTYKELAASMQPLFPLGNSLNVSYKELFGSMATLTGVTGNTAEVTTQMKGLFTGLLKPTDSMGKLMKKYGYENGQAMIKSEGMSGVLKILKKETGGQSDKMAKLFSNSRALTAALALTGAQYDTFREKTAKMGKAQGSTQKALKDMQTSMSKIRKAVNVAKNSLTIFGDVVLQVVAPPATKVANKLSELSERFSKLSPSTQKFIVKAGMIVAAVGPAVVIIGTLTTKVGGLIGKANNLYASFQKASSISTFIGPGGKIALVLGAIAIAAVLVYKNWDKISAGAKKMKTATVKALNACSADTKKLGKTVKKIGSMAASAFKTIGKGAKATLPFFRGVAKYVSGAFKAVFGKVFPFIIARTARWLKSTLDIIHGVTKMFSGLIKFLSGVFTGDWKKAWSGVKDIFKGAFEALTSIAKRPLNSVIALINAAISGLNKVSVKIPSWVPGKYSGKSFGINLPKIPMLAKGTNNWQGGIVQVHERGGEIIDLPKGSRVYPHDKSVQMAKSEGKKSIVYKIEKLAETLVVREDADIDKIVEKLVKRLEMIPQPE